MNNKNNRVRTWLLAAWLLTATLPTKAQITPAPNPATGSKQPAPAPQGLKKIVAVPEKEEDFYQIISLPVPEEVILEVGGMAALPDGSLAVCTRRGEVWLVSNPSIAPTEKPHYKRFAHGLHEALGLAYKDGAIYVAQRGELTRLRDTNGDGEADSYDKVYAWPLSGNYHEYSYGPAFLPNGNLLVTLNLGWSDSYFRGVSLAPWRGWALEITPAGHMMPFATGMRSPAGYGFNAAGDFFYTENQGDWVGSGRISHVEKGDFLGNAEGLRWTHLPGSPLKLKFQDIPDTGEPLYEVAKRVPPLKNPAVWLPHGILGTSTSALLPDSTNGKFGPFQNQLFVGDQGQSKIMRVDLEKVKGAYQGVAFPFREGFSSGILRTVWGHDASMFVGMTNRGWSSVGKELYGLQRLVWTGKIPFEMKTIRAMPDGFEIEFTLPVDRTLAASPASYNVTGFSYKYHATYGSPVIHNKVSPVRHVVVAADGLKARLVVDALRLGYIHEITAAGIRSANGQALLHNVGYYTLNNVPDGENVSFVPTASNGHHHPAGLATTAQPSTKSAGAKSNIAAKPSGIKKAKRVTTMPADWQGEADYTLNLGTKPGLKFDPSQFQVRAGSRIRVVFTNNDDMLHNFVLVLPGTALTVGQLAMALGLEGQQQDYIPPTDQVLHHTRLLPPNAAEVIYFKAPEKPGDYPYECSVPGHFYSMQGIMKVVK